MTRLKTLLRIYVNTASLIWTNSLGLEMKLRPIMRH